jgi:hypothetical protein
MAFYFSVILQKSIQHSHPKKIRYNGKQNHKKDVSYDLVIRNES